MKPTIDIDRLADLAKLYFSEEEKVSLAKDMDRMIEFADRLSRLDTDFGEPIEHIVSAVNVLREDLPYTALDSKALLAAAPTQAEGYITVPLTVKSEEGA